MEVTYKSILAESVCQSGIAAYSSCCRSILPLFRYTASITTTIRRVRVIREEKVELVTGDWRQGVGGVEEAVGGSGSSGRG